MKKIRKTLVLSLLLISIGLRAHQPNLSSTILMEQGENNWVLQLRGSLTAFEYEVRQTFGDSSYSTAKEFQEQVLIYVKEHVSITVNNEHDVLLKFGTVKLGHETVVSFKMDAAFESIGFLKIKNKCFSNISQNKSHVFVVKDGFEKSQFALNNENNQTIELKAAENRFELIQQTKESTSTNYFWLFIIPIFLTILFAAKRIIKAKRFRSKINEVKIWI